MFRKDMKVQQKPNISRGMISEKYTTLNISYETKKKAVRKIMTTLLTHNAVVSILMENL